MCRISGIINPSLPVSDLEQLVTKMCDLLRHGGPDDGGVFTSNDHHLALGNRRLALQDISSAGHQPMQLGQRYVITYNGELYNFKSLRTELIALGHHFFSGTDTEVILAAFSQWNVQSFEKFNGMFAFALFDKEEGLLYLVRDAAGMKPLYYSLVNNGLAFASEMKAFSCISYLNKPNANWPVYLLAYGHLPEPITTLSSVCPLKKGCFLKYNISDKNYKVQSFKHYSYTEDNINDVQEQLKNTMKAAVERHMIADAPIGVFLSGGIDSGIISTVAATMNKDLINTCSLYFEEEGFSEKKYQDLVIKRIQSRSHQQLMKEEDFHASFSEILQTMDMPCSDGINTWFISKLAKQEGLKAVLSGIGADELFGGYPSFNRIKFSRILQELPEFILKKSRKSGRKQLNRLSYLHMNGIKGVYLFLRGHFSAYEIAKQLDASEAEIWSVINDLPAMNEYDNISLKNQASWMEFNLYMQNQLLRDADVMGMAHGVEIRVPFLDDEIISLVTRMKPEIKFKGPLPKQILIECFKEELPKEIWNRPKMGFSFPFAKWLNNSEFVCSLMSNARSATQSNYRKFQSGDMHWSHLMSLIILSQQSLA